MARIVIPVAAQSHFEYGEWSETDNGDLYIERSVQGAKKNGPFWGGRAMVAGEWFNVKAGATISGQPPTEWELVDPDAFLTALDQKAAEAKRNGD